MLTRTLLLAAGLLLSATAAQAASTPDRLAPTSEFYFDADDSATKPVVVVEGAGQERVDRLLAQMRGDRDAKAATAQLAHLAMTSGQADVGRGLYDRVLKQLDMADGLYRPVLWNYGWDLYRLGEHAAALARWRTLLESRDIDADWMPTTFALALWTLDRQDEAVQWYAAAVRSEPRLWRSGDNYAELLPGWTDAERAILTDVHAAWAANPPAWN